MHEATKSILSRRNAALHLLCLQFYVGDESIPIAQTAACSMKNQMIGSMEFIILTKKEHSDCTEDDVLFHGRQLTLLFKACPNAFGGLARLKLDNLSLNETDLPNIFSVCNRLEFLRLYNCDMGILSSLEVEHPQIREMEMDHCRFERVHLKSLSLTNIALSSHKMLKLSEFLGNATISSLQLNFKSEKIWIQPEGPKQLLHVFRALRLVNFDQRFGRM
ncbi:hypothetical protein PR202_ga02508 [Eleusine coracana subsp. coracana]|uniref:Uncharacterized protein n=1 Tax=Eleusine coracana subsp. coracana TaxID=191504 RepID=A0AAV5BKB5_ELECO|nr:hypothetical protein PR202_ga02508 [Eleusine coracana subsp. coracana]